MNHERRVEAAGRAVRLPPRLLPEQEPPMNLRKNTIDMMRHAVSHASRNYCCVEVNSMDWSRWMGLELLGLARGGVRINECRDQYFHVTPAGLDYIKKIRP